MIALNLKALDLQDLDVISTFLQDALIPGQALLYDPEKKTLVLLANRFRWENDHKHERVHTGVVFSEVTDVQHINFDPKQVMNLLAIRFESPYIRLIFSGSTEVRLKTDKIHVLMRDISEPWPAVGKPSHTV